MILVDKSIKERSGEIFCEGSAQKYGYRYRDGFKDINDKYKVSIHYYLGMSYLPCKSKSIPQRKTILWILHGSYESNLKEYMNQLQGK